MSPRTALVTLLAALPLVLSLGACAHEAEGAGGPVVGVSLLTQQHDFYKDLEGAMREAAERAGLRLVVTSAEFDPARQTAQVEDFVTQRVAAVVVSPCDSAGIAPALRRAQAAGIPVFTADIAAEGCEVVSHVASDNVQGGRLAAERMAELLGGEGEIVIIDHPEVASVQDRVKGFLEGVAGRPALRVVGRPSAGGDRDRAYGVAESMLQAHPRLAGIFGINDDCALGALRAIDTTGRRNVVVIGYDAQPEAREAIRAGGPLKADVVQYPERIGRRAIELVADHLAGKPVPKLEPVPVALVDRESLQAE